MAVHQLAAQLGPDRPPCPGHHHHAPGIGLCDLGDIQIDLVTAQQLIGGHRAQAINQPLARHQIDVRREHLHLDLMHIQLADQFIPPVLCHGGHGQQDLLNPAGLDQPRQFAGAMHRQTRNHQTMQVGVVVDEKHRPRLARLTQRRGKLDARGPCPVNRHRLAVTATLGQPAHQRQPHQTHRNSEETEEQPQQQRH